MFIDIQDPWPDIASEVYQVLSENLVDYNLTEEQIWEIGDGVVDSVQASLKMLMKTIFP